jgi:hypothetical protein
MIIVVATIAAVTLIKLMTTVTDLSLYNSNVIAIIVADYPNHSVYDSK